MDNRPTVLFADDNAKMAEIVCALLNAAYRVIKVVSDGEQAIRSICDLKPDFAVVDISISKINGLKIARMAREAGLPTRILFIGLINDEDYKDAAKTLGFGYVLKSRLSLDLLPALSSAGQGSFFPA